MDHANESFIQTVLTHACERSSIVSTLLRKATHLYVLFRVVNLKSDTPCDVGSDGIESVPDKKQDSSHRV